MTDANGSAAIAILGSLVDALIKKGLFTKDEAKDAIVGAYGRVSSSPGTNVVETTKIIGEIIKRFM
jgi:hypothetical protein